MKQHQQHQKSAASSKAKFCVEFSGTAAAAVSERKSVVRKLQKQTPTDWLQTNCVLEWMNECPRKWVVLISERTINERERKRERKKHTAKKMVVAAHYGMKMMMKKRCLNCRSEKRKPFKNCSKKMSATTVWCSVRPLEHKWAHIEKCVCVCIVQPPFILFRPFIQPMPYLKRE